MELTHGELVAIYDQMTLFTEDKVMNTLFKKEEMKSIEKEIRELKSRQSVRETTHLYRNLLKEIGKEIVKGNCNNDSFIARTN